jgi:hypothetical protein
MNKALFVLLLTTTSCGYADIKCREEFYAAGIGICSEKPLDRQEIEYSVGVLEEKVAEVYPQVSNLPAMFDKHWVNVFFVNDLLAAECEEIDDGISRCEDFIGGVNTDNGITIYVAYYPCLADTSFSHELMHSIETFYLKGVDKIGHGPPQFYMQDYDTLQGKRNTVEFKTDYTIFMNVNSCADERALWGL